MSRTKFKAEAVMPKTRRKSSEKKGWFTVAYLTREGTPARGIHSFVQTYGRTSVLLEDLVHGMSTFNRGTHAVGVWPGQLTQKDVLSGPTKPLYYVYEGGSVEKL